ncbi:MAG: hypothetical protein H6832_17350 [Planctomycetes bacterium]|nr:hypothetical protein [Planctomycetota bacterium]MCB9920171.1 hypothetical protein [Planctomycetota bacterium]
MASQPMSAAEIHARVDDDYEALSPERRRLFDALRIAPERWQLHPWGDACGGFWVVALFGRHALYYNEIEDGFNRSRWTRYGQLDDYRCNQDELQHALAAVERILHTGKGGDITLGPPEEIVDDE